MRARLVERLRRAVLPLVVAAGMLLMCSPASKCQDRPKSEATMSYSYMRGYAADNGGTYNMGGASASFAINLKPWLGLVQDYGGYSFTGLGYGLGSTMYTYLYGPRFSLRRSERRWTPFGQVLLGASHINVKGSGFTATENSFAVAAGGGVDFALSRHFSVRVAQVEYLRTRFESVNGTQVTQNNFRFSAGLVVRLGTNINRVH
jgi:opacity protein-like surface antigen